MPDRFRAHLMTTCSTVAIAAAACDRQITGYGRWFCNSVRTKLEGQERQVRDLRASVERAH